MSENNMLYDKVIKIRVFENKILDLFSKNKLSGTTHTYIGEEATAAAVMEYVTDDDVVFSNHRCHGHYLAYGGPERKLLAEIMSKKSGLCQGKGGSQHICYKNFYTNGVQGGIVPNALGVAFSKKIDNKKDNTIVFIGDGTLGQGVVYESVNMAVIYSIPLVFIVEDNQYAMSTRRTDVVAGEICERFKGFSLETREISSTDVDELNVFFKDVFEYVNRERKPICAIVHNYRLGAHSKGDDTREQEEIDSYKKNDPIVFVKNRIGNENYEKIYSEYDKRLNEYVAEIESEEYVNIVENCLVPTKSSESFCNLNSRRCVEKIQNAFKRIIEDNRVIFLGEDIKDPYGGAFKATKGLSALKENQVYNMPISEACMVGMAVGMGLQNKLPVVEMMFGDFVSLGFDQLLNHATKYSWIYGNDISVPMVLRVPMGGKRGYGPTHSQSLEKFLMGIPNLRIFALSYVFDVEKIYRYIFSIVNQPIVVIENKKLYAEKLAVIENGRLDDFYVLETNNYGISSMRFSTDDEENADYTIITYGGMVRECLAASEELMMNDEIVVDVIVLSQISPLPLEDIKDLVRNGTTIVTVEEGTKTLGIGAEIITSCIEKNIGKKYKRIAAYDCPIPNGIELELQMLPNQKLIVETVRRDYYENGN